MTDNVTLDRIDFEKIQERAKLARAEYMRRHGQRMGRYTRAYHVIAVVAVLLVSFGVKMFLLSPPTSKLGVLSNMRSLPAADSHP